MPSQTHIPHISAKRPKELEIITDPIESAKAAGLRYVSDAKPGIRRRPSGKGFRYTSPDGSAVSDEGTLRRIRSLVIPPAWRGVWISPIANGHLQATGRDARGRKQSRYHPRWREIRDETKYERMMLFGAALPRIRERVEHDLALPGLPRERILAAIVRLLETTFIRVGNTEYAKTNRSYGLTTLRNKHVAVKSSTVTFNFKGKSGVDHTIDLQDKRLAKIVERCRDLPGYELFQYLDNEGNRHSIDASDVNDYLREIAKDDFTAKDFRTWAGTVLACEMLRQFEPFDSATEARKNVVAAIKTVAERLGNTPSVCRKCYVHPMVLDTYFSGAMMQAFEDEVKREVDKQIQALRKEELDVLHLLERRLSKAA
ncbi:MAG: DNA topoisomerase IB [Acidobacteriota bacterium]|nr:DNA topoisomerase IB [Acidobacteriota bacterium]